MKQSGVKEYICPGQTHPISRAVHLARLAASYPACRECPLADDPRQTIHKAPQQVSSEVDETTTGHPLFVREGVRGVYLNELTRPLAERIAAAFACLIWEESPISGPNDGIDRGARQVRPSIVASCDERPSSPGLFAAVVSGLRRMGCHVIDAGMCTRPCFAFAVDHLHAAGGVFVTGSGGEPSTTGLDFLRRAARPVSLGAGLDWVRDQSQQSFGRPTRRAGTYSVFQPVPLYEAAIGTRFAGVRPFAVSCASASPLLLRALERLSSSVACRLLPVELAVRARNPVHRRDADMLRLSTSVRESGAQLGILIDDDGQRCGFIDERGRHVPPSAIARLVVLPLIAQRSGSTVLLEPGAFHELRPLVEAMCGKCRQCPDTFAAIAKNMTEQSALYAGGDSGRHWFCDPFPTCDALIILAKVLAAASQADVPFSELAAA